MRRSAQRRQQIKVWAIPMAYAGITLVVGLILPRLEHYYLPHLVSTISASAGIAMSSSIASGMLALTGIVFSLVFVMVQFSASAYSPRLVMWVARDPVMSHALGMFIATFVYSLILLVWIDRGDSGQVPLISGGLTFVLLLSSMGMFIALIERIGMLQVSRMLTSTGERGRRAIEDLYPASAQVPAAPREDYRGVPVTQTVTYVGRPQVIQAFHIEELVQAAEAAGAVIEVVAAVGDTLMESTPLLRVYGARQPLDEGPLRRAIDIGEERTFEQDPKYAMRLLVDIAIKALSPAINDPTTAVQALDQIEDLLIRLGRCDLEIGRVAGSGGTLRVVTHFPTWDDFLLLALDEIRYCGASSVQVMRRMNALIKNLRRLLPPGRHQALGTWEQRLQGTVQRSFEDPREKEDASVADRQGLGIGGE